MGDTDPFASKPDAMSTIQQALNQGVELHKRGDLDGAERQYRQALDHDANNADAWHLLGLVMLARGDGQRALEHIGRAIELNGNQSSFHLHRAEAYRALARLAEAETSCRHALRLTGDAAIAHNTLGVILAQQQRFDAAEASYRRAIELAPRFALAHCNLGAALVELGQPAEAARSFQRAVACDPSLTDAHFRLGTLLHKQGHAAAAIECYRRAIAGNPAHAEAHNNLGTLYRAQGNLRRASECYGKALEFRPNFVEALNNLGNVLKTEGRLAEAAVCYEQSLRIQPGHAQALYNRSLLKLADGQFAEGWPEYEARSLCPDFPRRSFDRPPWRGQPLAGRGLLVHAEQGLGDTLQFVRYVPLLAKRGATIILEVPPPLVPLLAQADLGREVQLVAKGQTLPEFDCHVSLLSLPGIFGTSLDNIPAADGYLSADPSLVEQWQGALCSEDRVKVGIAWQGSPTYLGDCFRSIPLAEFAPLARGDVELVSLQKGPGFEQLAAGGGSFAVRQLGPDFDERHGAFMDTAAVMKNLDLVVTSDTAIAHLAGALGVPVWLALTLVPDWRWMHQRTDSPWYGSMRLFRQSRLGDWQSVFQEIAAALDRRMAGGDRSPEA